MTYPAVSDDVTAAASIVAMKIVADHVSEWHDTLTELAFAPFSMFETIGEDNWLLVLTAIKKLADATGPERKLYDAAMVTLAEAAQNATTAAKGVG